jgi:hypothetical protein
MREIVSDGVEVSQLHLTLGCALLLKLSLKGAQGNRMVATIFPPFPSIICLFSPSFLSFLFYPFSS